MKVIQDIRDRFVPVPEPKESKLDKALKIILFIITVAGIAALAYMAYKKFNEYMRNLCEANCEDYLDECCGFEFDDDDEAIFLDEDCCDRDIEVEVADEADFDEPAPADKPE
ncbi:MAG: hypothetical protein GX897_07410 [Clostridiales bacterium]|nr:hypothetical protein [Clostridiales bacterium]